MCLPWPSHSSWPHWLGILLYILFYQHCFVAIFRRPLAYTYRYFPSLCMIISLSHPSPLECIHEELQKLEFIMSIIHARSHLWYHGEKVWILQASRFIIGQLNSHPFENVRGYFSSWILDHMSRFSETVDSICMHHRHKMEARIDLFFYPMLSTCPKPSSIISWSICHSKVQEDISASQGCSGPEDWKWSDNKSWMEKSKFIFM